MEWRETEAGVLPLVGGPYDGGELDVDYIFAGRMPDKIAIHKSGPDWRTASYDLDIDADGPYYRFTGIARPEPVVTSEGLLRRRSDRPT